MVFMVLKLYLTNLAIEIKYLLILILELNGFYGPEALYKNSSDIYKIFINDNIQYKVVKINLVFKIH